MMKPSEINELRKALVTPLREEVMRHVAAEIEGFRRATYVREDWCCNTMRVFAVDVWNAARPKPAGHFGSVAYQLRGHAVNYCPFCGVAFASKSDQSKPLST